MTRAFLGLGSNVGDRQRYLREAVTTLEDTGIGLRAVSPVYETDPVGGPEQGRYLNLVMWAYSPENLTECWTFPRSGLPSPQQPRTCGVDVYYDRGHLSALRDARSTAATRPAAWCRSRR